MKKIILALAISLLSLPTMAQTNGSNSPYSRYGLGLQNDRTGASATGMSGAVRGMRSGKEVNVLNPASYSAVDSLSLLFDAGLSLQNANFKEAKSLISENSQSINARNTSIDYITVAWRATKNLGLSAGLLPVSTVGYEMKHNTTYYTSTGEQTQTNTYYGDGGLHAVYVGLGWQPFKGFSIGANGGYMWGETTNAVTITFSDANVSTRERSYNNHLHSYKLDFGMQYDLKLSKDQSLTLGLTYGLGHGIKGTARYYDQQFHSSTYSGDTIWLKDAYQWPHSFGAGLMWNYKSKVHVGFDYSLTKWGDCKSPIYRAGNNTISYTSEKGLLKDQHKIAIGADFTPNPSSFKWHNRIHYRIGASMRTPYTKIDGFDGPTSYNVSIGAGIPIANTYSTRCHLNVAFQYEHVKPKYEGMVKENYLRLCIGISFNEMWFAKWKAE